MYYRNSFDKNGQCSMMGESAEILFKKLLLTKGSVREATEIEQRQHIDFILTTNTDQISYDVKARKRIQRADSSPDDSTIFIEFLNVRGDSGWLYGRSNFIAFEREKDFLVVDRKQLATMAVAKCNLRDKVRSSADCLYRGYTRFGRRDLVSRVLTTDVLAIPHEIWQKL